MPVQFDFYAHSTTRRLLTQDTLKIESWRYTIIEEDIEKYLIIRLNNQRIIPIESTGGRLSKHKYLIFTTAACAILISSIDSSIVSVALPVFTSYFGTTLIIAGWTISIYQLVLVATVPAIGKISDVLGRKPTFLVCVGLFTTGSLLCSLAPNVESLIFFRFIQGFGGGGIMPSAAGIVADEFKESRQRAIGLFSSIIPAGAIIGPNLGGWLLTILDWRALFWVNIPIGIGVIIAAWLLLPASIKKKGRIDYLGALMVAASVAAFMVGLSALGNIGSSSSWLLSAGLLIIAGTGLVLFYRRETRIPEPIIDLEIMKDRPFIAANIYNFIYGAGLLGVASMIPTYAVSVYGMSTFQSGVILTPRSIGMVLASLVASTLLVRWGYRKPMIAGTSLVAFCFIIMSFAFQGLSFWGSDVSNFAFVAFMLLIYGIGMGIVSPAANNACIELMPERVATITGLRSLFRFSGAALGVTIATLIVHIIGDPTRGFRVLFIIVASSLLISIIPIYGMPASPVIKPRGNQR